MKRSNALPVGDLIYRFLREEGLESPLNEYRLIQAWETVLGKAISRYTGQMFIKNQHIHLSVRYASKISNHFLIYFR